MPFRTGFTLEQLLEQTRDLPRMPVSVRAAIEAALREAQNRTPGRKLVNLIEAAISVAQRDAVPEGTHERLIAAREYASGHAYVDVLDQFVFPDFAKQRRAEAQVRLAIAYREAAFELRQLVEERPDATAQDASEYLTQRADKLMMLSQASMDAGL